MGNHPGKVSVNAWVEPEVREFLRALGGGSASKGIRIAIRAMQEGGNAAYNRVTGNTPSQDPPKRPNASCGLPEAPRKNRLLKIVRRGWRPGSRKLKRGGTVTRRTP